ncbi:MAG TPA: TolC family protein [Candidatus Acidoferrum sp.]|nr:TolC family protein [Candidatus Acidoferrum sp.]
MNLVPTLRAFLFIAAAAISLCPQGSFAQDAASPAQTPPTEAAKPQGTSSAAVPIRLTLQDALGLARKNSTQYQAALTSAGLAREDRTQARDALLPSVAYNNSVIYTQGVGATQAKKTGAPVVFIANNAVHEYISQANIHEAIDVAGVAGWRRASAAAAVARAQAEIASRGLVVTVVQGFYNVAAAQHKLETAKKGAEEGDRFLKITQDLEHGGEVAHSDVIKAELQMRERRRQLQEAQLGLLNARLDFSVLIFPDFNDNFEVADDLHAAIQMPTLAEVQQQAARDNPDVRAALAAVQEANHDVLGARAGYLPSLTFDYFYGIDAPHFALNTAVGNQKFSNLGSSIIGTLSIPIWNWGATQSRVKQADLRRAQAKRELSLAQRKLLAEIQSLYAEAETALNEQGGLNRSAELAEESLRLTTLRYTNGEATVLEVVDAQTTYAQANAAYQDGAVRYRVALANLQTLTGVLTTP